MARISALQYGRTWLDDGAVGYADKNSDGGWRDPYCLPHETPPQVTAENGYKRLQKNNPCF